MGNMGNMGNMERKNELLRDFDYFRVKAVSWCIKNEFQDKMANF